MFSAELPERDDAGRKARQKMQIKLFRKKLRELSDEGSGLFVKLDSVFVKDFWSALAYLETHLPRKFNFAYCSTCKTIVDHIKKSSHTKAKCDITHLCSLEGFDRSPESFKKLLFDNSLKLNEYFLFPRFGCPVRKEAQNAENMGDFLLSSKTYLRMEISNLSEAQELRKKAKASLNKKVIKEKATLKTPKGGLVSESVDVVYQSSFGSN